MCSSGVATGRGGARPNAGGARFVCVPPYEAQLTNLVQNCAIINSWGVCSRRWTMISNALGVVPARHARGCAHAIVKSYPIHGNRQ
ncbi:hypothetical protein DA2_0879 [Desulfovibrio sp. A2]|nr:hypothetical protein DA2_0879 [Desulfovibrio sp. A2]